MSDKATILAVDDTTESLALLVRILTQAGYEVRPADSGELALAAVAANPPDMILLDIRMKGIDGLDVCRQLKANEATRHIPIILISAVSDVKDWVVGLQLGAVDYINKPFHIDELLARVKTQLTLSRAIISLKEQTIELRQINEQLHNEIIERQRVEDKLSKNLERAERSRRAMISALEDQLQAESRIKKLNRIYAILSDINEAIVRTRDLGSLFEQVCHIAVTVGEFRLAWIGLLDESTQQFRVAAHSGGSDAYFSQVNSTLQDETVKTCPILNALQGNQHISCDSMDSDPTPAPCQQLAIQHGCRSFAAFPLSVSGKVRGTMNFYASDPVFFDEDEITLLDELAMDISFAIEFAENEVGRKQVEERLAHERNLLRTLIDNLPDYIYTKDLAGRKQLVNRADLMLMGADTEAEVLGKTDTELYPASLAAAFMTDDREVLENKKMIINREELVIDHFGQQKWLLTSKLPLQNPSGQVVGLIGIGRDITERKQAELQILQLNAELEQRVRDRTALLENANKEMEAFTYSVSHDLRAPLRGIDGWSHVLLEENYDQLNEEGRQSLNFICTETKRMGLLIENLLHLSRVIHAEMQREPVDLSNLAEEIIQRLQREQPRSEVEVIIQPALTTLGDSALLEIVLTNLLSNAWKYTGTRAHALIELGYTEGQGLPAFFVRDNGVGFDMAYAQKLFGVFQRLHRVTEFPGTGIGLAIVQRIIHRHGGEVWAVAQVNLGATFYFTLPNEEKK